MSRSIFTPEELEDLRRAAAKSMIKQEGKGSHGAEQHKPVCEV